MNSSASERFSARAKLATLLGTASFFAMANAGDAHAQGEVVAQAEEIPETVLITGSLIRGTAAVGVPVTNLSPQDFANIGALNTADLFRAFPAANVMPSGVATNSGATIERGTKVNIRGLDTGTATRSLLMVDGIRFPAQGNGQCVIDPSIIPALSMDHIDVLVDGASATYGSDAVSGVINIILKRNMDGAITQLRWTTGAGGKNRYLASGVWGRTWDGGQITPQLRVVQRPTDQGNFHSNTAWTIRRGGLTTGGPSDRPLPAILSVNGATAAESGWHPAQRHIRDCRPRLHQLLLDPRSGPARTGIPVPVGSVPPVLPALRHSTGLAFNTAGNSGTNGLRNQFDPYHIAWYDANQQRNGGHITVDQRLTSNISFYGSAFYSNRRATFSIREI